MTFGCGRVAAVSRGQAHRPDVVEVHWRITVAVHTIATAAHDGEHNFFIYPVGSRGKIAMKNRGEKSRGKSNHIWAVGTPGAWAPDPNKKKSISRNVRSVGTYRRSNREPKSGSEIPIDAK
jgi:hypothetical protein